jgi:hypothetical protein
MSTKSLTDDEIEKVKKSIDLYEKIIQELGGSSPGSPTSAASSSSTSAASAASPPTSAASAASPPTSAAPAASSSASAASTTSSAVSSGPDGSALPDGSAGPDDSAVPDTSTITSKKGKKGKKVKSTPDTSSAAPGPAPAAAPAASTLTYSTGQENIIKDLELNKKIFEKLEEIRNEKNIKPPPDTDGFFGAGAHKFTGSILSGLNAKTGNNVWLKSDGFFVSKDGENYENQAITSEPANESKGDFNGKKDTEYYEFENSALGSLLQQGKNRTREVSKNLNISGGKTLKKRKGRSRKTKRK